MIKLSLASHNGGPFNCLPAREIELDNNCILCNDISFPWDGATTLWVVGNEYGALGAAWGNEQDALDELADADLLVSCSNEEEHAEHEHEVCCCSFLGNASEPYNLDNVWIQRVDLNRLSSMVLVMFAEARANGNDTL